MVFLLSQFLYVRYVEQTDFIWAFLLFSVNESQQTGFTKHLNEHRNDTTAHLETEVIITEYLYIKKFWPSVST